MHRGKALVFSALVLILAATQTRARQKPPEMVYPTTNDQQSLEDLLKPIPHSRQETAPSAPAPVAAREVAAPVPAPEPAAVPEPAAAPAPQPRLRPGGDVVRGDAKKVPPTYKVWIWQENGDTLWRIAQKVYGDKDKWPLIYEANRDVIKDPNKIYPKQVLKIPPVDWQP